MHYIGPKEDWSIITDLITPGNLEELGDPSVYTIAACLGGDKFLRRYTKKIANVGDDNLKVYYFFNSI